ncbi:DUF4397 domain-containing protein [Geodermatophilus sabuli]|uniref:DUF4397 domain-containing protein n=1 Tax=Geodermatophilus sabuli TaxID=1564158 RepID=A0A7K3VXT9_9ACTN|nr:DUF4397 domain-containing protein [Geodermatophilus sabuli]NEK57422.1 DUF4397 domain-containing protein [Geodermatophilus sabuli]
MARALGVVLLGAGLLLAGMPTAAAAESGLLRLVHLSPDTPAVDVYVDSVSDPTAGAALLTLPGVGYGTISDYQDVPPGVYAVSMRTAGAEPTSPPVLSTTVEVAAGTARTVAGVGRMADLGLAVLDDDLTPPPTGSARVRVVAAAAGAPTLDVSVAGGGQLAEGLQFAAAGEYVTVPAGSTTLQLTAGSAPTEVPVDLRAGAVYTVLVLDRPEGGLTVRPVLDAAGAAIVPSGGVDAGGGGTAGRPAAGPVAVGATLLVGAALGLGVGRHRSRPGRR